MKERYELVSGIFSNNKTIKRLEKQYDKLCEKIHSSEVVQGVSAAIAFIGVLGLAGKSDVASIDGLSISSDPSTWIVGGVCALSCAVSFLATMIKNHQENKADELAEEIQSRLNSNDGAVQELENMEFMDRAEHFHDDMPQESTAKDIIEKIKANHAMQKDMQEGENNSHEIPQNDDSSQGE